MADSKKIIKVQSLMKKGAFCEEIEDFEQSIFEDVYQRAASAVMQIVGDNREKRRENTWERADVEIPNVVSFIGRRGTGKTSSMLSFLIALKTSSMDSREYAGYDALNRIKKEHIYFCTINYIDVSLMNAADDVFVLVLGNLLESIERAESRAEGQMSDFLRRDILQQMEKIYDAVRMQNNVEKKGIDAYSAYEKLRHINGGQRIREMFAHLVKDYLAYMCQLTDTRMYSLEEQYLVVAIDDVDMCDNNLLQKQDGSSHRAYEMINILFRYMSVPGVIILCSYHEERLYGKCIAYFAGQGTQYADIKSYLEQAKSHMEKTFSPVYRIYMPSWRKRDYHENRFYVDVQQSDLIMKVLGELNWKTAAKPLEIKQLIMLLYAGVTGVYFDPLGQKTHFIEPDSLRELNNSVHFLLDSLQELDLKNPDHIKIVHRDILKNTKNDVYFRFFEEKVYEPKEREWFRMLSRQKIDRRSEEIVRTVAPRIQPLGYVDEKKFNVFGEQQIARITVRSKDNRNVPYSYAELVHCIYHMTRLEKPYSRELVACILYSYSVYLNQLYEEYREERLLEMERKKEASGKKATQAKDSPCRKRYEILKEILGRTVCGRWSEYFMGRVSRRDTQNAETHAVSIGYMENERFTYRILIELGGKEKQSVHDAVREMAFLLMLHVDWNFWNNMTFGCEDKDGNNKEDIQITFECGKPVEVDMTMFLKYSFCYQEFFKHFQALWDAFLQMDKENWINKEIVHKSIGKLRAEFVAWEKEFGSLALPVQNFDLMYNLIKRMHQEGKTQNVERIIEEDKFEVEFWNEYDKMLGSFRQHLSRIDKFYHDGNKEGISKCFRSIFDACPFINLYEGVKANMGSSKRIILYLSNMINNQFQNQNLMTSGDEVKDNTQGKQTFSILPENQYISKKN